MIKTIKCQPKLRKRKYDETIVGKIVIEDKLLEPGCNYVIMLKRENE